MCLVFAAIMSLGTQGLADDWAHWRGPEQNGISRDTGLPDTWSLDTKENVIWSDDIGGRSTPIVMNNRIYINSRTIDPVKGPEKIHLGEQVVCRDATTGKVLWQKRFNVFQTDIPAPRVGWAAMAGDPETKQVYAHSVSGLFRCYSEDGEVVWEKSLFEDFGKISGYGGRTQTPIVDEDRVIVSFFFLNWGKTGNPPPKHTYFAFDKRTGKLLWQAAPGGRPKDTNYSAPLITVIDGQRVLIAGNADGGIYAMNARTGKKLWGHVMSKRGLNTTPVVDDSMVYIAHGEDNEDNTEFGRVECFNAKTGESVWRVDGLKIGYTALLVKEGVLYAVADTGRMYAFDSKTGARLWDYSLGTVGKGSPIWADGKIYAVETNGNIHVLKADRNGCKELSKNRLKTSPAAAERGLKGMDEVYASPAVSNGKVYFVTRDRTICIGKPGASSNPAAPMAPEKPSTGKVAHLQLVPYEVSITSGESVDYELHAYDENGVFVNKMTPKSLTVGEGLSVTANGATLMAPANSKEQSGEITTTVDGVTATARVRVFPPAPWKWDFTGYKGLRVPPTWINATKKLFPTDLEGNTVMRKKSTQTGAVGRPSTYIWLGPSTMKGYTVQTDFRLVESRRQFGAVGVTAHRYNFIVNGNKETMYIQSWASQKRMARTEDCNVKKDTWYTMKIRVDIDDNGAHVKGKFWPRDKAEPADWSIQADDPHPNTHGSPGLYFYALADSYIDNVSVYPNE